MSVQAGKFFDVKKTKDYFDGMNISMDEYIKKSEIANAEYLNFFSTDAFRGKTAKAVKMLVKNRAGQMLDDAVKAQNLVKDSQDFTLSTFATEVDPAPNARIEYNTLRNIETDFKGFHNTFKSIALSVENIADRLNGEFGSYGYFGKPDSRPVLMEYEDFCGGDADNTGYLSECIGKLVRFDGMVNSYITSKQIDIHSTTVSARAKSVGAALMTPVAKSPKMAKYEIKTISDEPVAKSGGKSSKSEVQEMIDEKMDLKRLEKELAKRGLIGATGSTYLGLSDDNKAFVDNIDKLDVDEAKKVAMRNAAVILLDKEYDPKFVVGVLANIQAEGTPGKFESSNYEKKPAEKPTYLIELDKNYNYRQQMSGRTISEIGISETQSYLDWINDPDNGSSIDLKFGIGLCQWTDDDRVAGLMTLYNTMCSTDHPTISQCAAVEATYLAQELTSDDYADIYNNWDNTSGGAAHDFCTEYEKPKGAEDKADDRKTIAEEYEKILLEG